MENGKRFFGGLELSEVIKHLLDLPVSNKDMIKVDSFKDRGRFVVWKVTK